ncbi:glycosyltransferase [Streptomyces sanyensis]|uniref:glycosyltransferase n=1 Tax=Streptomyces sanyensis TaxID=568869 RepID=UPI003D7713C6
MTRGRPLSRPLWAQVAAVGAAASHRVDLVHAVIPVGGGFATFSRLWPRLAARRPVLHTVPSVVDPAHLWGARPLGRTVAMSAATAQVLAAAGFGPVDVVGPVLRLGPWPPRPRARRTPPMVLALGDGGAEEALLAAGVATRAGARFQLVLVANGQGGGGHAGRPDEDALRAIAAREGLLDMEVLRRISDMPGLLAAADVLLYVPRALVGRADVPAPVLQALATGRPVILSDLPQFAALRDTVLRGPVADPHRTGHLLRELLDRPWWWEHLAERGGRWWRSASRPSARPRRTRPSTANCWSAGGRGPDGPVQVRAEPWWPPPCGDRTRVGACRPGSRRGGHRRAEPVGAVVAGHDGAGRHRGPPPARPAGYRALAPCRFGRGSFTRAPRPFDRAGAHLTVPSGRSAG